ncbi:flagellin [Bacillus pseudomycoides]|nr:flagellin [Bacillus pseudomycoides]
MRINTNIVSMKALQSLHQNERHMNTAMERLATGKRINSAADDAAGLAIVIRMHARERGMRVAIRNNEDTISMLQTAESSLHTITNILFRMRDLAVQAANGTNSSSDQNNLDKEFQQLVQQIGYIEDTTTFNTIPLFDNNRTHTIPMDDLGHNVEFPFSPVTDFQSNQQQNNSPSTNNIKISTTPDANAAIAKVDTIIDNVSLHRADLGAMINRLQFNIDNLNNQAINLAESASRIEDADIAQEMSEFVKYKLLTEVALSMVSQANQIPQMIAKLLQQ